MVKRDGKRKDNSVTLTRPTYKLINLTTLNKFHFSFTFYLSSLFCILSLHFLLSTKNEKRPLHINGASESKSHKK